MHCNAIFNINKVLPKLSRMKNLHQDITVLFMHFIALLNHSIQHDHRDSYRVGIYRESASTA